MCVPFFATKKLGACMILPFPMAICPFCLFLFFFNSGWICVWEETPVAMLSCSWNLSLPVGTRLLNLGPYEWVNHHQPFFFNFFISLQNLGIHLDDSKDFGFIELSFFKKRESFMFSLGKITRTSLLAYCRARGWMQSLLLEGRKVQLPGLLDDSILDKCLAFLPRYLLDRLN